MMQLRITNIRGQIGIRTNDAILSIRQPWADMQITTRQAKLNINNVHPQVIIDQSRCFSEIGRKGIYEYTGDFAREGMTAAVEAAGQIVQEGNRMAWIENKADAIAEIATEKALPPTADFNITLIPQSRPTIDSTGRVSFNPEPGAVNINFNPHLPEIQATGGQIEMYMQQKPVFSFEFVGSNVDIKA